MPSFPKKAGKIPGLCFAIHQWCDPWGTSASTVTPPLPETTFSVPPSANIRSRMWRRCLLSGVAAWLATVAPASAFIAYVSNEKSNTVSVIDTDNWTVTKTIKVGQRPRGIEFTRDGKFVFVAVGDDDTIQVIDTATQQIVDSLPSGPDPELFAFDTAGKLLYVANENDNTVTIIDVEKRTRLGEIQVGVEPEGMATCLPPPRRSAGHSRQAAARRNRAVSC